MKLHAYGKNYLTPPPPPSHHPPPTRLEVKIEIGLPSEEGRLQILQIHTKEMDHNGYLSSDVSLPTLATELKNYTGAEIAGICRTAAAYTLKSQIDLDNIQEFKVDRSKLKVKMDHFRYAARESKPAFGIKDDELKIFYRNGIIDYGPEFQALKARIDAVVNQVRDSDRTPLMSVLLSGPPGAGRTALAAACAQSSGYPFAKMITADMFIGHSERSKIDKIFKVFEDAAKTPLGIIVLDDLERILSYVDLGPQFSNPMLQALMVLLNKPPKEVGRRVLVIGTTSCAAKLARLGITSRFNVEIDVPPISRPEEFQKIMQTWADMSPNVAAELSQQLPEPIPIKRLLMVLEMARQSDDAGGAVTSDAFHKCLFDCGYRSLDGLGLNK